MRLIKVGEVGHFPRIRQAVAIGVGGDPGQHAGRFVELIFAIGRSPEAAVLGETGDVEGRAEGFDEVGGVHQRPLVADRVACRGQIQIEGAVKVKGTVPVIVLFTPLAPILKASAPVLDSAAPLAPVTVMLPV